MASAFSPLGEHVAGSVALAMIVESPLHRATAMEKFISDQHGIEVSDISRNLLRIYICLVIFPGGFFFGFTIARYAI